MTRTHYIRWRSSPVDDIILDNTPVEVEDTAPATYQAIGREEVRDAE